MLECVPAALAARITEEISIPTIGIGAGPGCDGQVLVWQDMLGLCDTVSPKFVKRFGTVADHARGIRRHMRKKSKRNLPAHRTFLQSGGRAAVLKKLY